MNRGDAVGDAILPDEEDEAFTTLPGGSGRTATVRKGRGRRECVNGPEEKCEGGGLGSKRHKEEKELQGALLKLMDVQVASTGSSGNDVPHVENPFDHISRVERKTHRGGGDGSSDFAVDGFKTSCLQEEGYRRTTRHLGFECEAEIK